MERLTALAGLMLLAAAPGAMAQEVVVYGGVELEYLFEPNGSGSDDDPMVGAYIEVERLGFYAGIWGEVHDDESLNEIDLYLGYRNETAGGLSYDLSYWRYTYPEDSSFNYGEIILSLGKTFGDSIGGTLDLAWDPDNELGNAYVGLEYYATDKITLSANYGVYEVEGAGSEREWDFGASYALTGEAAVDLRYYDGSEYVDGYFGLSLTFDTTILGG